MDNITVELSAPLNTHKGEVRALTFKPPTARCFINFGEPFKTKFVGEVAEFEYDNKACVGFFSDMCGVEAMLLDSMSATDWLKCRNTLVRLTLGIVGENPTAPSAA